jgi:quercetin dioxygenase-like cupin family protein
MQESGVQAVKMQVVSRAIIPSLKEVIVEGREHNLGELLDFRKHPSLSAFIPDQARISISWVSLMPGEVLDTHRHPTSSMIIICEGEGKVVGDCQQDLKAGDVVIVPSNANHGFIGGGKKGFWALSIQFEGLGLYENPAIPRVEFMSDTSQHDNVTQLLNQHKAWEKKFESNPLMILARSPKLKDPTVKKRLLEALNYWSDWFQKIITARMSMGGKSEYFDAAEQHLQEEIGHNKILYGIRKNCPVSFWNPLLDSAATWFHHQMISGTDEEKTVLIHLVLEGASTQFHTVAKGQFLEYDFFDLHSTLDEDHFGMGLKLLENSKHIDTAHLLTVLNRGWAVFSILAEQMALYALSKKPSVKAELMKGED